MIPKFRAFIKANTETVYGGLVYSDDCVLPVGLIDFTDGEVTVWGCGREDCGLCGDDFSLDDIVLMQSTGLKDKNGVEIFEGDVIRDIDFIGQYSGDAYEVVYNLDIHHPALMNTISGYETNDEVEVLGNVYENPELMEVPK